MNIVDQLLTGSSKLNLMQSDITKIIKMVVHQLGADFVHLHIVTDTKAGEYVRWQVFPGDAYAIGLELHVDDTVYCDDEVFSLPAKHILPARELLDKFIAGLLEKYPNLRAKLEPILTA